MEVNNDKNRRLSSTTKHGFLSPNKNFYFFENRDIVFDLIGHIKTLFAQNTPKIYKEIEK